MIVKTYRELRDFFTIFTAFILPVTLILTGTIPYEHRFTILIISSLLFIIYTKFTSVKIKKLGISLNNNSLAIRSILPLTLLMVIPMIIYFAAYGQRIDNSYIPWYFYIFVILVSSPLQEFLYRGYLFHCFSDTNRWQRIILSSFLYSYLHTIYHDIPTLVMTFIMGLLWGLHYERFKNLYSVSLSHAVLGTVAIATGMI